MVKASEPPNIEEKLEAGAWGLFVVWVGVAAPDECYAVWSTIGQR
jgi:hypothetical protein